MSHKSASFFAYSLHVLDDVIWSVRRECDEDALLDWFDGQDECDERQEGDKEEER